MSADDHEGDIDNDVVAPEVEGWEKLTNKDVSEFLDPDTNMINEFKMMHALRFRFPLHHMVFQQIIAHLSHEADVESLFSLAKGLTHLNMDPRFLRVLTLLKSATVYKPTVEEIWAAYKHKYNVHAGVELGGADTDSDSEESDSFDSDGDSG